MTLTSLPSKLVQSNVEELTTLAESGAVNLDWAAVYDDFPLEKLARDAIKSLATYGNGVLLADIVEAEEYDSGTETDALTIRLMTNIYAKWIDVASFVQSKDNLLNAPIMDVPRWKPLFDHELAKLVVERGTIVAHRTSFYGWEEEFRHAKTMPLPVALFQLHTKEWEEFAGSNPDIRHSGFQAHVLYSDGTFRNVRYEASLEEVMELLSQR